MNNLTKRIWVKEEKNEVVLKLNPSKNYFITAFQGLLLLGCIILLIEGVKLIYDLTINEITLESLLFTVVFNSMIIMGLINTIKNLHSIMMVEEMIKIDEEKITLIKNGILRRKIIEVNLHEIEELLIENESNFKELKHNFIEFITWTNFILKLKNKKIEFFKMTNYQELIIASNYIKSKSLIV